MKARILTLAALVAAMLSLPSQARAPQEPGSLLILAQGRGEATCKLEERNVPQGMTVCREGYVMRCSPRGSWEKTGKTC